MEVVGVDFVGAECGGREVFGDKVSCAGVCLPLPFSMIKDHSLLLEIASMCLPVTMVFEKHGICKPSWLVVCANQFDSSSNNATFVQGLHALPWYLQVIHKSILATHI